MGDQVQLLWTDMILAKQLYVDLRLCTYGCLHHSVAKAAAGGEYAKYMQEENR